MLMYKSTCNICPTTKLKKNNLENSDKFRDYRGCINNIVR